MLILITCHIFLKLQVGTVGFWKGQQKVLGITDF